ncbi:29842_t:CDS:1, partial [Racocetra persica]
CVRENDMIVLDNSEKENKKIQAISVVVKVPIVYKVIKVYILQSTTFNQR